MAQTTNLPIAGIIPVVSLDTNIPPTQPEPALTGLNVASQIPVPRRQAMEAMLRLTTVIGGERTPLCLADEIGIVGYRLPSSGITLLATSCRRPLLCDEAQSLREAHGDHMLIVRIEDEAHGFGLFTVDLLMADAETWLTRYRLWQIYPTSDLWLVPSQGEGRSIRIVGGYLAVSPRAPFFNLFEREHGFNVAARTLAALQGAQ